MQWRAIILAGMIAALTEGFTMTHAGEPWQADPAVVEEASRRRPEFNYHEAKVPRYQLPDPLRMLDGRVVADAEAWAHRRAEILELFRAHMFGRRPERPDELRFEPLEEDRTAMDGAATLQRIAIHSRHDGREHQFELVLFLPNDRPEPVPVFLLLNLRNRQNIDPTRAQRAGSWPAEEVIARGYGIAALQVGDLAPDDAEQFHEGVIRLFEGDIDPYGRADDAWMALAAWGWGGSRALDYLETLDRVDPDRVAVLGHSRGGKASLWAGAEDTRFALVISNNSGAGGAALSRRRLGETVEALNRRFPHWFCESFNRYNGREDDLPFDQHMLMALIAPRAVYIASASDDLWADPRGEFLALAHASPVYDLWNHPIINPEPMPPLDTPISAGPQGYHIRPGGHGLTLQDWQYYMDFADRLWGRNVEQ
jgi:hypothetical protein